MSGTEKDIMESIDAAESFGQATPYSSDEQTSEEIEKEAGDYLREHLGVNREGQGEGQPQQQQQQTQTSVPQTGQGIEKQPQQQGQQQGQQPGGQQQQQQGQPQLRKIGEGQFADQHGNIVDQNGNIIASRGAERRIHERAMRLQDALDQTTTRLQELEYKSRMTEVLNGLPQKYGLDQNDVAQSLALAQVFKQNPVQAAREIVAMAMQQGYNLSQIIGEQIGDSVDMRAITQLIDQRLTPLTQDVETRRRNEQIENEARRQYNQFLQRHEHANVHETEIARLAQQYKVRPEEAYLHLRNFAEQRGLDFSKPLKPQVEALMQQQQQPTQQQHQGVSQPQQRAQLPMPNGSGTGNVPVVDTNERTFADVDASWDEILRSEANRL